MQKADAHPVLSVWQRDAAPSALAVDLEGRVYAGYEHPDFIAVRTAGYQLEALSPSGDVLHQWRVGVDGGGRSPSRGTVSSTAFWGLGALAAGPRGTIYYSEGRLNTNGDSLAPERTGVAAVTMFTWNPVAPEDKETKSGTELPHGPAVITPSGGAEVALARGLAASPDGAVLISDTKNKRVLRFDPATKELIELGGGAGDPDRFALPWGIAVAANGQVMVADAVKGRILVWE